MGEPVVPRGVARLSSLGLLARDSLRLRKSAGEQAAQEHRERVVERLAELHGLPQKLGQLLASSALDSDGAAWHRLTSGGPALPAAQAFAEIERHLGRPIASVFRHLEPEGIGASLGQVHRGTLHDGREVAVKVKLPGIAEAVALDLKALGLLTAPVGGWKRGFDTRAWQRGLGAALAEELDYRIEAEHLSAFGRRVRGRDDVVVPRAVEELSGEHLLVMDWVEGDTFEVVRAWPSARRRRLGESLLRLFFEGALDWGLVHADPHPGNYRFRLAPWGTPALCLLDFGCVRTLSFPERAAIRALISLARDRGGGAPAAVALEQYLALGFDGRLLEPMAHLLPELTRALFAPLCTVGQFPLEGWRPSEDAARILGDFRWNFRFAGPPRLFFLIRAWQGLVAWTRALRLPLDWGRVYDEVCGAEAPAPPLQWHVGRPAETGPALTPGGARALRVRVMDGGRQKVELTFRAAMVEHLADLIPEELGPRLDQRGIDLEAIAAASVARGIAPQALFELDEGDKLVRVWLE